MHKNKGSYVQYMNKTINNIHNILFISVIKKASLKKLLDFIIDTFDQFQIDIFVE